MRSKILLLSFLLFGCSSEIRFDLKPLNTPASNFSSLSRLYTDNTGTVFMSWVEQRNDSAHLYYSKFIENEWIQKKYISGSDSWFVNWADFPSLIAKDGEVSNAHWLQKVPGGTYAYQVVVASTTDNWVRNETPHKDNTPTEHGFVSMIPVSDSTFMSIWLDGRNTGGHGHASHSEGSLSTAMTLRSAILNQDLEIKSQHLVDPSVCDCCGTAAVKTNDGYLVAYRNRTENEVRDIYVSKFRNGEWSEPTIVHNDNWEIAACPVNGPALASNNDNVAIAWYTGANEASKVKIALSKNSGNSFEAPLVIDGANSLGRVDVDFIETDLIAVSWMKRSSEDRAKADFEVIIIDDKMNVLTQKTIAKMSSSRKSGFPQITAKNGNLIASWTSLDNDEIENIETVLIQLN